MQAGRDPMPGLPTTTGETMPTLNKSMATMADVIKFWETGTHLKVPSRIQAEYSNALKNAMAAAGTPPDAMLAMAFKPKETADKYLAKYALMSTAQTRFRNSLTAAIEMWRKRPGALANDRMTDDVKPKPRRLPPPLGPRKPFQELEPRPKPSPAATEEEIAEVAIAAFPELADAPESDSPASYGDPVDLERCSPDVIQYPFPCSGRQLAHLFIPVGITQHDANRLATFVRSLGNVDGAE